MGYEVQWESKERVRTLDVARVVALEQAIAADGTSLAELMDRAGASVAGFVEEHWPAGSTVVVFCGKGNNGGDGWVAAGLLAQGGYRVRLVSPCTAEGISAHPAHEAAQACMERVHSTGGLGLAVLPGESELEELIASADVVVDGMLGTGFHYESLHEPMRSWVGALAAARELDSRTKVVAIDVPSGLNAQTGVATDPVVRADYTVTMMALKTGLATERGRELRGETHVARIAPIERYL